MAQLYPKADPEGVQGGSIESPLCPPSHTHTHTALVAMLHIKLMEMDNRTPCKYILCPYTHPRPPRWGSKGQNKFTESSLVAYKINGIGT